MATRYAAYGTTIGPTAEAVIAGVRSVTGPSLKADTIDVTTHDSTAAWEEAVVGILRSGDVKLEIEYDPLNATHANAGHGLLAQFIARTAHSYTLTFPSAVAWVFSAFVTGFEPSAPHDKDLTATVTLKVTANPTLA